MFHVLNQPPPDIVERMSQSEHFYGNPVYGQTPLMVRCLFNACVHCKDKPFVVHDSVVLMSSTPNCRSGQSEVAAVMS